MVEHRTENSGVRGSNPFIGIVFTKNNLKQKKLILAFLKFNVNLQKLSNITITSTMKNFLIFCFPYIFNLSSQSTHTKLYFLSALTTDYSIYQNLKKKKAGKRRAELLAKNTELEQLSINFSYMYPLLNKKGGKYFPAPIYDSLQSF